MRVTAFLLAFVVAMVSSSSQVLAVSVNNEIYQDVFYETAEDVNVGSTEVEDNNDVYSNNTYDNVEVENDNSYADTNDEDNDNDNSYYH